MSDIRLFIEILALIFTSFLTWYLTNKFEKRPYLIAGTTKASHIRINPETILSNHTLTIRNIGKKEAKNVQIIHLNLPELFQVLPAISYCIQELKDGRAIVLHTLVPNEEITICYMYSESLFGKIHGIIKHDEGTAVYINILLTREYSKKTLLGINLLMFSGAASIIYGVLHLFIKFWNYLLTLDNAL